VWQPNASSVGYFTKKNVYINMKFQTEEEARRSDQHSHPANHNTVDDIASNRCRPARAPPRTRQPPHASRWTQHQRKTPAAPLPRARTAHTQLARTLARTRLYSNSRLSHAPGVSDDTQAAGL